MKKIKLEAYLDDIDILTVLVDEHLYVNEQQFSVYCGKKTYDFIKIHEEKINLYYKIIIKVNHSINLRDDWKLTLDESIETEIVSGKVVRTKTFLKENYYEESNLGVNYNESQSTFKLWAPIAKEVHLLIESPDGQSEELILDYDKNGTWHITVNKDLENYKYIYNVYVNGEWKKVKDPYAFSSNANGEMQYIINKNHSYRPNHSFVNPDTPIIYEVCVRDFSSDQDSRFLNKKKYLGLIEEGLVTKKGHSIGFDYVRNLGITHVQLLPIFDFTGVNELNQDEKYNWGYNPSQYFLPEGSYTDLPNHPYKRINDLKMVIDKYHEHNIGIIMDVVYNHVDYYYKFPYEILTPGYSFRLDEFDIMTDFSGCGNDLDASRPMIKKLIIDSLIHWLEFYKMDGFRVDLMGLIDYNTMNEAYQRLKEIKPDVLFYGEGWKIDENKSLAHMYNPKVNRHIGFFNDQFRDSVKGSTFNSKDLGLALGNLDYKDTVEKLFKLKGIVQAESSINYIECHDNQTFFDKALYVLEDNLEVRKHQIVANCMTIFAPGTPFIHFGQELYRSKSFEKNSYNLSDDINQVKWNQLDLYKKDVDLIKTVIDIRKKIIPYLIDKIKWIESTLVLSIGKYDIYLKVENKSISIINNGQLILKSADMIKEENKYRLNDIGVYIFERK